PLLTLLPYPTLFRSPPFRAQLPDVAIEPTRRARCQRPIPYPHGERPTTADLQRGLAADHRPGEALDARPGVDAQFDGRDERRGLDRKSTRLNSSHRT